MGASKLPTKLKEIRGTKRTSRTNKDEPLPDDDQIVPPKNLTKIALIVWHDTVPHLREMGILGNCDVAMLAMYCQYYAEWQEGMALLHKQGMIVPIIKERTSKQGRKTVEKGHMAVNPLYHTTNKRFDQCMKMMVHFGMSPVARAGVSAKKGDKKTRKGFGNLNTA